MNSIQTHPSYIFKILFNGILPYPAQFSMLSPSGFPIGTLYVFVFYLVCGTCPTHLILLGLITRLILDEEHGL